MYNSVVFSLVMVLYFQNHYLILEHFYQPTKKFYPFSSHRFSLHPTLKTFNLFSACMNQSFMDISCKWNNTAQWYLGSWTYNFGKEGHICVFVAKMAMVVYHLMQCLQTKTKFTKCSYLRTKLFADKSVCVLRGTTVCDLLFVFFQLTCFQGSFML